jgi:cytochrome P450
MRRNAIECWTRAHFEQPLVAGGFPFAKVLVVSEPAAIAQVLVENAPDYCKSALERRILSARLRNGLVAVDGEQWTRQRRMLAPMFARHPAARFGPAIEQATDALIARWKNVDGGTVEVKTESLQFAMDVLLQSIFGDGIANPEAVRDATTRFYTSCGRMDPFDIIGLPAFVPRPTRLRENTILRAFNDALRVAIAERRRSLGTDADGPRDILGAMLAAKDLETGEAMIEAEVKDNVMTFIFGGQETTSSALTWAVYLLSQSAEWRERVIAEAETVQGLACQDALPKLVETRAVVDEALRLYPPIIGITRTALRRTQIADHTVERGTMVIVPPYVVHRHRRLWRDPDAFDPTRFLPEAGPIRPYTYLPFGAGPRMCIGAGLAAQEATYALAMLALHFEFDVAPGHSVWPAQKNFTLRPQDGLHIRVRPRQHSRHGLRAGTLLGSA